MAIKRVWSFTFSFIGDGTSTSVVRNLLDGTVSLDDPNLGGLKQPLVFPSSASLAGVNSSGLTVSSASVDANGVATVIFSSAPANGTEYTVNGQIQFE